VNTAQREHEVRNRELRLVRAVALAADQHYNDAERIGRAAAQSFAEQGRGGRSQVTGLEAVANSALRVTEIFNYIKKQVGKDSKGESWRRNDFGRNLLEFLDQKLSKTVSEFDIQPPVQDGAERQRAHLLLARAFLQAVAAHFEFERTVGSH